MIVYEVATGANPDNPKRSFRVDRYSEAPRGVLEDILGQIPGIRIVERQRVDAVLLETEFGRLSGLVDPEKAVKLGKMLGADAVVMGSILDVGSNTKHFSGYGIQTRNTQVRCAIRVRIIDIASGTIPLSRIVRDSVTYASSRFGGVNDSDVAYSIIDTTLENLRGDESFGSAIIGGQRDKGSSVQVQAPADGAASSGDVEVEFAPKPENSDIEIDGVYLGGSPLKRSLPQGKEIKVRIVKAGYKTWETRIVPTPGLRITKELEVIASPSTEIRNKGERL